MSKDLRQEVSLTRYRCARTAYNGHARRARKPGGVMPSPVEAQQALPPSLRLEPAEPQYRLRGTGIILRLHSLHHGHSLRAHAKPGGAMASATEPPRGRSRRKRAASPIQPLPVAPAPPTLPLAEAQPAEPPLAPTLPAEPRDLRVLADASAERPLHTTAPADSATPPPVCICLPIRCCKSNLGDSTGRNVEEDARAFTRQNKHAHGASSKAGTGTEDTGNACR